MKCVKPCLLKLVKRVKDEICLCGQVNMWVSLDIIGRNPSQKHLSPFLQYKCLPWRWEEPGEGARIGGIDTKPLWPDSRGTEWLWLQLLGYTSELSCFYSHLLAHWTNSFLKIKFRQVLRLFFSCYCKFSFLFLGQSKRLQDHLRFCCTSCPI